MEKCSTKKKGKGGKTKCKKKREQLRVVPFLIYSSTNLYLFPHPGQMTTPFS